MKLEGNIKVNAIGSSSYEVCINEEKVDSFMAGEEGLELEKQTTCILNALMETEYEDYELQEYLIDNCTGE